jgi:hypothetical protein
VTVWDTFPYWRERWAIEARLRLWGTLAPDVDYQPVALVGDRTHRGDPLPGERDAPAGILAVFTVLDADGPWEREAQQRDAVRELLPRMAPDDLVLLCDADELVDPRALPVIVEATETGPVKLRMALYCAGTRWRHRDPWRHAAACRTRHLTERPSDELRLNFALPKVDNTGWHLTYFGTDEDVDLKLKAFAHAECDTATMRQEVSALRENGAGWIDDPLAGPLADILAELRVAA